MKKDIRYKDLNPHEFITGEVTARAFKRLKAVEENIKEYKGKISENNGLKKLYKAVAYRYEQERFWLVYILTNEYPKEEEF